MKPLNLVLLPLLFAALNAACQDNLTDKDGPGHKYKRGYFELTAPKQTAQFPFAIDSIEVCDLRQDTSKFGYFRSGNVVNPTMQYCFKNGAVNEIAGFLNHSYNLHQEPGGQKLLYCLKKLWIINADTVNMQVRYPAQTRTRLYLKAELYLAKDSCFYPLYRFDSVFIFPKPTTSFSIKWVEETLLQSLERIKSLRPEKVMRRTCVRQSDMNGYYSEEKRTAVAVADTPQKGVYMNVEQFKNNRPAYTEYEITFDKLADVMRVKDNEGNYTLISKDWGFCDGRQFFIRLGPNYFRLFKMGDTYDLYGTSRMEIGQIRTPTPLVYGPGISAGGSFLSAALGEALKSDKSRLGKLKPLQLDMETGMVY
ncbi:MAG TPA: hypothetical protein VLD19_02375 [Chitinophagaceae bacterium]|nr:hypothetical protein [Chitinophagaceae bacterium]